MLLAIGTKVKLKHTGDRGEVVELLPNGMVNVYLFNDDMEIPVFEDDLIPGNLITEPVAKRIIVPDKKPKITNLTPPSPEAASQYTILKSVGLQLAFEPVLNDENITEYYRIWLLNDSKNEFIVTMAIKVKGEVEKEHNSKIKGMSKNNFGTLLFDKLNDNPVFELQKWRISSRGTEGFAKNTIKLKAKTFFSKMKTAAMPLAAFQGMKKNVNVLASSTWKNLHLLKLKLIYIQNILELILLAWTMHKSYVYSYLILRHL